MNKNKIIMISCVLMGIGATKYEITFEINNSEISVNTEK